MKILRLDLLAYGHFKDLALDLSGGSEGLQLIYGANEAGKSTALRALRALFYGIETRTPDGFLHENENLRVGAVVRHSSGGLLDFVRRKGSKNTFLDRAGQAADETPLRRWLSGVDEQLFTSLFGIDHARLRAGGEAILKGGGNVGESLFAAGLGGGSLRVALQKLDDEAAELFKPQGHLQAINRACKEHGEVKKQINALSLSARDYEERQATLAAAQTESARVATELQGLRAEIARLQRLGRGLQCVAPRAELQRELASHGDVAALLAQGERITELHGRIGVQRNAARDLPALKAQLADAERETARLSAELPATQRELGALTRLQQQKVQALVQRRQAVASELEAIAKTVRETLAEVKVARENLAALGEDEDGSTLRRAVETARKEGNLELELARAEAAIKAAQAKAERLFARLQPRPETIAECERLSIPAEETIARFDASWAQAERRSALLEERRRQAGEEAERNQRALDELLLAGEVPSEGELAALRAERDAAWQAIRADLARAQTTELAAYERLVKRCDELSDALRRDADRVARKAQLDLQASHVRQAVAAIEAETQSHAVEFSKRQDEWRAAWAPLIPRGPREMVAWRAEHSKWLEQTEAVRAAITQREEIERRAQGVSRRLQEHLKGQGIDPVFGALADLVEQCQGRAESLDRAAQQRAQLKAEISKLTVRLETACGEQEERTKSLDAWHAEWRAVLESIGWPAETIPTEANALTAFSAELQTRTKEAATLRERISTMEASVAVFAREAAELCASVAPDLKNLPPEDAVSRLHTRARHVQSRQGALAELEQRLQAESGGAPIVDYLAELEALDADALQAQTVELLAGIERLEMQQRLVNEQVGEAKLVVVSMDGEHGANEAAERAQTLLAQIDEQSERYIRLRLGAAILRREIERYRTENQDPLLSRAGVFFQELTLGSFAKVTTDFDASDNPILKGVRPSGDEVTVVGMSEGTRDQLFLALQLASVEKFIAAGEPMPFIVDDVLIAFDQEREAAVLKVLAELSQRTQVIVFTHHAHLVELAERTLTPDVLHVHRLPVRRTV